MNTKQTPLTNEAANLITDALCESEALVRSNGERIFKFEQLKNFQFTDRLFAGLMFCQWIAGIVVALLISPRTWYGQISQVHIHVWSAILIGGVITFYPIFLALTRPGKAYTRHIIAIGQVSMSALLIHLTGGRIETHFHIFGSLAFLAFYRDWKVLIPATVVVAADHWIRGVYWPQSVYGVFTVNHWRWVEHAGWVIFEDIILIMSCLRNVRQMKDIAYQSARLESINQIVEVKIQERTRELFDVNAQLKKEIADRERLERVAAQSEKMAAVGQLAGGIAHDLNNGLTPVMGYLDFLLNEAKEGTPTHGMLSEARQSAMRCSDVVEKLLSYSRPSAPAKVSIRMIRLFGEYKTLLRTVLPATVEVEIKCAEDIRPVQGNETELMTVLMNLAINARDAMSAHGGKFSVRAGNYKLAGKELKPGFPEGDYVMICVSDTGTGMPPEIIQRIFEPFFTTKAKGQGTGLGLAMVFNVVKGHGGWLDVSSKPGEGTVFKIYLPAATPAQGDSEKPENVVKNLPKGNETILFVDDEERMREMGKSLLQSLGYRIIFACDGEEAGRVYQERQKEIGAVITDMTMPKLTGKETIKRLKEINPAVKIIASSGYTSEGNEHDMLEEGARAFLRKPYTMATMATILRGVLDK